MILDLGIINLKTEKMEYYLISMKHTQKRHEFITLWNPNERGYTYNVGDAGIYDESKASSIDSEYDSIKIPTEIIQRLFIVTSDHHERVPNCKAVWNELGLMMNNRSLRRK